MIRAALLVLVAGTGCRSIFGLESPQLFDGAAPVDDLVPHDAMLDAPADSQMFDGQICYGTGIITVCPSAPPTANVTLDSNIDTDTDTRCSPEVSAQCAIMAANITVGSSRARGTRLLLLVATGDIAINGTLDAGSRRLYDANLNIIGEEIGAGEGTVAQCGTANTGGIDNNGSGGGAGGSFGGTGGTGGPGDNSAGGPGGAALAAMGLPTTLRGGCPGGAGGNAGVEIGGPPGHGGGAIYIIANGTVTIGGTILVGGQGGRGGRGAYAGGGGGGSGGFVGIDAFAIGCSGNGEVSANGGAGGEGGGINDPGRSGLSSSNSNQQAICPATNANGGDGGDGSFNTVLTGGNGLTAAAGGGGGGGGAGIIHAYRAALPGGCNTSPPPI